MADNNNVRDEFAGMTDSQIEAHLDATFTAARVYLDALVNSVVEHKQTGCGHVHCTGAEVMASLLENDHPALLLSALLLLADQQLTATRGGGG